MRHHTPHARALAVLASFAMVFGGLAFLSALAVGVAPASAAMAHRFVRTFNGAGEAPEALQNPGGVAVDNSTTVTQGDVYVGDASQNVVDRFDSTGKYLGQLTGAKTAAGSFVSPWGLAVDPSNGDLYVADRGHDVVDKFTSLGSGEVVEKAFGENGEISAASIPAGQLGSVGTGEPFEPNSIAVDPRTGEVYVSDAGDSVIDVFGPDGVYVRQFGGGGAFADTSGADSLALDSSGDLFLASGGATFVYFAANGRGNLAYGEGAGVLDTHVSAGVAVDPADEDVYVSGGGEMVQYSNAGVLLSSWGSEYLSGSVLGVAVGDTPGGVYVANQRPAEVAVFAHSLGLVPDASTGVTTAVGNTTAALSGALSAGGGPSATCAFQYVKNSVFEASGFVGAPSAACFPAGPFLGSGEEAVSAGLSGLMPETEYRYRLVGSNENGPNPGATRTFKTLPAVNVQTAEATSITVGAATLNGTVTPAGQPVTECFFEYGASGAYGQTKDCEEPSAAGLGNGSGPVNVHANITGLVAEGVYHFRLVASNASGTSHGADQVLGELPRIDGTSVASVTAGSAELQAQIDPGGVMAAYHFEYLSEAQYEQDGRSFASGPVLPAKIPVPDATVASARGDVGVAQSIGGLAPESAYYYRVVAGNSAAPGGVDGPVERFVTHPVSLPVGLPDGRVYEMVSPSVKTTGGGVYGVVGLGQEEGKVGVVAGYVELSEDGSAAVYEGEDFFDATKAGFNDLYSSVRGAGGWSTRNVKGDSPVEAFAPVPRPFVPSVPVLPGSVVAPGARVLEGTPDGSEIFFLDGEQLTPGSTAGPGEPDLYRYDAPSGRLTDLTVARNAGEHANVRGILGVGGPAGAQGSYVYLVADGDLTGSETNGHGDKAQAGQPNLYLWHGGGIVFIGTLSAEDNKFELSYEIENDYRFVRDWEPGLGERTAEVSPNGRYVAFSAREELTGQPAGSEKVGGSEVRDSEVFRYDAGTGSLVCVSCTTDGSVSPAAFLLYSGEGRPREHYMADDGRVFFDDAGPLTEQDVNGRVDVYEFEDAGTGTCQTAGGCRLLISGGGGSGDSFLAAVSGEGSDVFFVTTQQLVPEDQDGVPDLYDARVDGRTPSEPARACETGEACHEPAHEQPALQIGGSAIFSGPGNLTPAAPMVESKPAPKPRALTRAQKLAKALRACQTRPRHQRASCQREARERYGSKTSVKKSSGRSKS